MSSILSTLCATDKKGVRPMEVDSIKEFKGDQEKLRIRLIGALKDNPKSMRQLSRDIDISALTLTSFLKAERLIDYLVQFKIMKFLDLEDQKKDS